MGQVQCILLGQVIHALTRHEALGRPNRGLSLLALKAGEESAFARGMLYETEGVSRQNLHDQLVLVT